MRQGVPSVRVMLALLFAGAGAAHGTGRDDFQVEYFGAGVRGDLSHAEEAFSAAAARDPAARAPADASEARFLARNEASPAVSGSRLVERVVCACHGYRIVSGMKQKRAANAEADLHADLRRIPEDHGGGSGPQDRCEDPGRRGRRAGPSAPAPRAGPYPAAPGLWMLWNRESRRNYTVTLTDGPQPVTVVCMSDFSVPGWIDLATLGHTSGESWATETAP